MQVTNVTKVTKGDTITDLSGRRYAVLQNTPQENGTLDGRGEANYAVWARREGATRASDLIINQHLIDTGLITVTR